MRQALGMECGALACYLAFPTYNPDEFAAGAAGAGVDVKRDPPPWARPSDANATLTFPLQNAAASASGSGGSGSGGSGGGANGSAAAAALSSLSFGQSASNGTASGSGSKPPLPTDALNTVPISPSSAQVIANASPSTTVATAGSSPPTSNGAADTKTADAADSKSATASTASTASNGSPALSSVPVSSGPIKLEKTDFHPLLPVSAKEKEKEAAAAAAAQAAAQDAADAKMKAERKAQQEKERKEQETRERLKAERNANAKYPRSDAGMLHIRESILPILNKLIVDPSAEVRTSSSEALVRVAHLMDDEEIGRIILTLVLCLAHDESDEQRTTAVAVCTHNSTAHSTQCLAGSMFHVLMYCI